MRPAGVVAGLFLVLAVYCGTDPLKHSPIYHFPELETFKVDLPPMSEVPKVRNSQNLLQKSEIKFLNQLQGPESIAFDPKGRGPYTGVADGRILLFNGTQWTDFAYTSSNRSDMCDPKPSPWSYLKNEHICGRPLGLRFHKKTGELYIADAYFGLMKVGPEGGVATSLTNEADGIPLGFTNDLDIDEEGNVYFTDSSTKYQRRNFLQLSFSAEPTGRVLKYNPDTKETNVLLQNLHFANGLSLSKDGSFFAMCEGSTGRLWKYWLKGDKAGKSEIMAVLPGYPDNVRTNEKGEFWVAIPYRRSTHDHLFAGNPKLRKFILKLPISLKFHAILAGGPYASIVKYSPEGKLLQILEDNQGRVVRSVSEVEEKDGKLWIGSVLMPFIAVYNLQ